MTMILQEPWAEGLSIMFRIEDVLVHKRTEHQDLLIGRTETYGLALFLDDLIQSTEADEAIYHELFVHPALLVQGQPRRVLVSGAGEGATIREVLRHPTIESVLTVDLDPEVVEACRTHMPQWSQGAFEDPRVELRFEDVQDTLRGDEGSFDAILLDITDPVEDGPSVDLFTTRFFSRVADSLSNDGVVVLQAGELDPLGIEPSRAVRSTLLEVFPWVRFGHLHVPSFGGIWSIALAAKRPLDPTPSDLDQRYARLPREALRVYTPCAHRAMLELPPYLARQLEQPGRVVTGADADRLVTFCRSSS